MMMNAFINASGVLTASGYMESNGDDQLIVVGDDFNYIPGTVQWTGSEWVPVAPVVVPPTREEIVTMRRRAYADHETGSDRFFMEAARILSMGGTEEEAGTARSLGVARALEIQEAYPWP
jgi:hypothetical protein